MLRQNQQKEALLAIVIDTYYVNCTEEVVIDGLQEVLAYTEDESIVEPDLRLSRLVIDAMRKSRAQLLMRSILHDVGQTACFRVLLWIETRCHQLLPNVLILCI